MATLEPSNLLQEMKDRMKKSRTMLNSLRELAEPLDVNDPLFKAYREMGERDQFKVFRAALNGSMRGQWGGMVIALMGDKKLTASDIVGLMEGTMAIRHVDFHAPSASEEINTHIDIKLRFASLKQQYCVLHDHIANTLERWGKAEEAEREREKFILSITQLDAMIEDIRADIDACKEST